MRARARSLFLFSGVARNVLGSDRTQPPRRRVVHIRILDAARG
jgi:hypothetical protein